MLDFDHVDTCTLRQPRNRTAALERATGRAAGTKRAVLLAHQEVKNSVGLF